MQLPLRSTLALLALVLGGCGGDSADRDGATIPMPASLPGVYAGPLPCSNCVAIDTTLWLRSDGTFFLRQILRDDASTATADAPTFGLGRWHWDEHTAQAVLRGAGPERRLVMLDADRVRLLVASPVEHVLVRNVAAPPFADRLRLDGESTATKDGATFAECLTGLSWPVAEGGAGRELRRQQRVMNPRAKVALTTIEGHLETTVSGATTSETLVVDRFVTIKPGTPCRG